MESREKIVRALKEQLIICSVFIFGRKRETEQMKDSEWVIRKSWEIGLINENLNLPEWNVLLWNWMLWYWRMEGKGMRNRDF